MNLLEDTMTEQVTLPDSNSRPPICAKALIIHERTSLASSSNVLESDIPITQT